MTLRRFNLPGLVLGLVLGLAGTARAQLVISEFMADNVSVLADDEGDFEDWIEVWNTSTGAVATTGWSLTDSQGQPRKWPFPSFTMAANSRRILFASDKDRRNPGAVLHTNFKLSSNGEYLALIGPTNQPGTEFQPNYPPQAPNVSYGMIGSTPTNKVVASGRAVRWRVPVSTNEYATNFPGWNASLAFNDTQLWVSAATGVGYDLDTNVTGYLSYLGANGSCRNAAYGSNASVFLRIKFVVSNAAQVSAARLDMKYDDGFSAWVNGSPVATDLAPPVLNGFSRATSNRAPLLNSSWAVFNLTNRPLPFLNGTNLLAIQALNVASNDANLLALPELSVTYGDASVTNGFGYLYQPTPTNPNSTGRFTIGPIITGATAKAPRPAGGPGSAPLAVTATVEETLEPIASVRLYYRTMFSNEAAVTMTALSGSVYGASIPTTNLAPGQMIRWRFAAVDTAGATNTMPAYLNTNDGAQYYGTVAADPSTTNSKLPVFEWFIQDTAASITYAGTRGSFLFLGEFYDNSPINLHGQSSSGFAKKPFDIYFNSDHFFLWREGEERVHSINILSDLGDKSKIHNPLSYETFRDCGAAYHWDFPVRVQRNGLFLAVYPMVENPGGRFLTRLGRDNEGALYKMYNNASSASGNDKITRTWESTQDLTDLITNLNFSVALDARRRYAYDNIEIPASLNYFVGGNLSSHQDHLHKNYYLYRDNPTNTAEWAVFPWDIDLTWGRDWLDAGGYFQDTLFTTNSLDFMTPQQNKGSNRFYTIFFEAPDFRRMYLRRLRTCMDAFLQTNGTPANQLRLETRINQLIDQMDPPGQTNTDARLDYQTWMITNGWGFATNREARTEAVRTMSHYLTGRRDFLYGGGATVRGEGIPAAQPPHMPIAFAGLDVNPASGNQDHEYFSLVNTNDLYVDLSGWSVTGAVNYTFKPGVVIPPGGGTNQNLGKLFVARSSRGFRSRTTGPGGNQYCFVQGGYSGQLSARGESLYLLDDTGAQISSLSWTSNPTAAQNFLRVTEIMYHPAPPTAAESNAIPWVLDQDFEYLEIRNISSNSMLPLAGVRFAGGVDWVAGAYTLYPTVLTTFVNRGVIVANSNAFRLRYGNGPVILGVYTGFLDNAGEKIQLLDGAGELVQEFTYNNAWYPTTDGHGFSLVIRDEYAPWDAWDRKENWRPSGGIGGNPAAADPGAPDLPPVLINEALSHTDPPQVDAIELFNPTALPVNLGGWFLSDDFAVPRKYRIPSNTFIGAWGYLSFDESQFNFPSNAPSSFRLSSTGDDVWLFSADAASNLTGHATSQSFGAAQNSVSLGRFINRAAEEFFVAQGTNSLGFTNAYPRVGPVVISELMYHPPDFTSILTTNDNDRDEYLELASVSASNAPLYDVNFPANTWRLRNGVDYDFPTNIVLPPGGRLLVVGFDPAVATNLSAFRAAYTNLATNLPVYGPWSGKLANSGDAVELRRPDAPNSNTVPYLLVEEVRYRDAAPWPSAADGTGLSLQRIELAAFGSDPYNWYPAAPTPGTSAELNLDTDDDGAPDWAEHFAGTEPTDALSFLRLVTGSGSSTGAVVRWTGVHGKTYALEASSDLAGGSAFVPVQTGIVGLAPETAWFDPAATNALRFYRIRVEP